MRSPVSWTVVQICKFIRAIFVAQFTITLRLFMLCFEHRVQISTAIWQVVLKSKDLTLPGKWTTIPLSQCAVRPYSHREIKKAATCKHWNKIGKYWKTIYPSYHWNKYEKFVESSEENQFDFGGPNFSEKKIYFLPFIDRYSNFSTAETDYLIFLIYMKITYLYTGYLAVNN